ncbi:uncharacterized protein EI90DRAFT_2908700 [Cantharellus anzutake]|uniref:uncharacterized protein n=1 Tax=Cantharellus anzutake TaxID=1750568 RepID=UPI0019064722|nr:uncharacterized protein EI90DRAFT_2908700 [Cantharellus anzutake]KAF8339019.1 hypothetical protein EI90DRAFT_2908700 [Cantharellus anzutake]
MPRLLPEPLQALPEFSSLCISGPYPASSPIHLCISQARHGGRVLLVTKSKESFLRQLGAFNDAWLNANIGLGRYVEKVSNIDIM